MDQPVVSGGFRAVGVSHASATSNGTDVVDAVNAKPATWTQLVASTAYDASGIIVTLNEMTTANSGLLDIAIGASGSEAVILPDLLFSVVTGAEASQTYFFPIFIPKGSRLAGRIAVAVTGTFRVQIHLLESEGPTTAFSKVDAYGATLASSRGTLIDPGATINTKPALPGTQIVASTTRECKLVTLGIGQGGDLAGRTAASTLFDLMAGASSSEYNIIENFAIAAGTSKDAYAPGVIGPLPIYIPQGTRLSARAQSSNNTAGDRAFDIMVYGIS